MLTLGFLSKWAFRRPTELLRQARELMTVAEEQRFPQYCLLAVLGGLKRPPLAWRRPASHLATFLGSAERGRFFVPA
jgi:hypothetical protein